MSILHRAAIILALLTAALSTSFGARAETLPAPSGRVILTVSGAVTAGNAPGSARFDFAMLDAMATETLATSTPWTQGPQKFDGFRLATLLKRVGATGSGLKATALNDYATTMPIAEAMADGAFVAIRQNGQPMSVRDRGPLWIVFPYDSDQRLTTDAVLNRSVWQLKELVVD